MPPPSRCSRRRVLSEPAVSTETPRTAHASHHDAAEHTEAAASTMTIAGWASALGEMELMAHAVLRGEDFDPWEPPAELGALPQELEPVAREVSALQQRASWRLEEDRARLLAQLRAARAARVQLDRSTVAVFVDVRS